MPAKRPYGRSRRDLAETAIRTFEAKGFAAATVEEIAAEAGYSPRTFFRQFPTKEDAVFFDLPDILHPLEDLLEAVPSRGAWSAVSEAVIENSAQWEAGGPALAQSRTRLIHEDAALYRRFLEYAAEWEIVVARVFAAERDTDFETDAYAQAMACAVIGACRTAMRLWLADPTRTLEDHMRAALEVLQPAAHEWRLG